EDRIELALSGAGELIEAAAAHRDYIVGETLALVLDLGDGTSRDHYSEQTEIEGLELHIALSPVEQS
ncbi:MAG TPA: hypothetical protein VGN25_03625, partial [Solirubrobacteraceae bacterium]|nr:hypothetical protein [Solirubrobacteraceae bacterium]